MLRRDSFCKRVKGNKRWEGLVDPAQGSGILQCAVWEVANSVLPRLRQAADLSD
jgi:hypothetical protein